MTDRYQIIRLIIKNQLGGVYLAQDTELDRKVVFRHLDPSHDGEPAVDWKETFTQYVAKLQALQHPNLIAIHDAAIEDDDAIVIFQFIEAETVADCIQKGPIEVKETVNMAIDLLTAMQAMHSIGIYHGAMHTASIQRISMAHGSHTYLINDLGLKRLSAIVMGKETQLEDPVLIPAELYGNSNAADTQSDLFMVGQLCYTALAGGHPFAEYSPLQCSKAYRTGRTPPLRKFANNVPPELTAWISGMIDSQPKRRPASAEEALKSLQSVSLTPPKVKNQAPLTTPQEAAAKKSNRGIILIGVCALAIITGLFFALFPKKENDTTANQAHAEERETAKKKEPKETASLAPINQPKKSPPENSIEQGPNTPKITQGKKITPADSMKKSKRISITPAKFLDWSIPLQKDFTYKPKSPYNMGISWEKKLQGTAFDYKLVEFSIQNKSSKQKPTIIVPVTAKRIKATNILAQAWDVTFRPAHSHKGPLEAVFYLTQQSCDINFLITFPNKKQLLLSSPSKGPGVVEVKLVFPEIIPNKLYNIQIKATPTSKSKEWVTGLHGAFLQKPSNDISKKTPTQKPTTKPAPKVTLKPIKKQPEPKNSPSFNPVLAPYSSSNHFSSKDWYYSEGSIIKVGDDKYCLFYSRWPKSKSIHARITHPEIAVAISNTSSGPWKHWKTILKGRKDKWDKFGVSHPIIKKFEDGYYLYYVSTSAKISQAHLEVAAKEGNKDNNWKTLNNNRSIGVAHAKSYRGPWNRMDKPIVSAKPPFLGFSCSPSVTRSPDEQYVMMVCSQATKNNSSQRDTISYMIKSAKPLFSEPATQGVIAGEALSFRYNPSNQLYQFILNGDNKNFFLLHSEDLKHWYKRYLPKPTQVPIITPVQTKSLHKPHIFIGSDDIPEVFIFHSEDPQQGGIFTIPFKK